MASTFSKQQFDNYLLVVKRYASRPTDDTRTFDTFLLDMRRDLMLSTTSTRASLNGKQLCDDAQIVAQQMAKTCSL